MAKLTVSKLPKRRENGRVYIDELSPLINREQNTIRMWERYGVLPKRLHPKRGYRKWRYWTDQQVFGKNGIIAWMKKNDMRPGKIMTEPEGEADHIKNLRRPRLLTKKQLAEIDQMIRQGWTRGEILVVMFERTKYSRIEGLEIALVKYYKNNDMYFPPKVKVDHSKLSPEAQKEIESLERKLAQQLKKIRN
jgi:DNA-binding transcriptional MerR regulator